MADLEIERKERVTRAQAAKMLSALADALAGGAEAEFDLGGTSLTVRVADDLRMEVEVEVDGTEIEMEIELKWSTAKADPPADTSASTSASTSADDDDTVRTGRSGRSKR
jgi:amphi-Trp domain-containing protein